MELALTDLEGKLININNRLDSLEKWMGYVNKKIEIMDEKLSIVSGK